VEYHWDFAAAFRHWDLLAAGAVNTFKLAGAAIALAVPLGLLVALLRLARVPVLAQLGAIYTDLFRTAPSIVLIFWFFFAFPLLVGVDFSTFTTVTLALGLQTGAYLAEVFRGGIQSVAPGQWQAARALGMGPGCMMRHIILPQAARRMLPIAFTRLTELFKTTSLAAAISYAEIVQMAQRAASESFRPVETFTVLALFFFVVIFTASRLARLLEQRWRVPE
jgi:polar amino acid transport system permease protein